MNTFFFNELLFQETKSTESTQSEVILPIKGKNGALYTKNGSFCWETQNYPDAINQVRIFSRLFDFNEFINFFLLAKIPKFCNQSKWRLSS